MAENNDLHPMQKVSAFMMAGIVFIKAFLIADPKDLYGTALVTKELKDDARLTSGVLSGANLLDFFLSQGILIFAFAGLGNLGVFLALCTNLGLLNLKNYGGVLTVRKREGSNWIRFAGWFTLVSLSGASSIVSGVGSELTLNASGLTQIKAQMIIEQTEQNIANLNPPISAIYNKTKQELDDANQKLARLPSQDSPGYDSLYVSINGTYAQEYIEKVNWAKLPIDTIPLKHKEKVLFQQKQAQIQKGREDWDKRLVKRANLGNDLLFVKEELPSQYALYFKNDEEFKSGTEAISVASLSFFGKLAKGDLAGSGASLFFASLSIFTSIAACWLVWGFPHNKDAQKSWSEAVKMERDRRLHERRNKGNTP